jgi:signal transduction histidine kinase
MQKELLFGLTFSIVSASFLVLLLAAAGIMFFLISLRKKNKLILEKERMEIAFEKTILNAKLEIQEQTFSYISSEIHDNVLQLLGLARLNLNRMEEDGDVQKIVLIDEQMGNAIADLRNLSHSLSTDVIRNSGWIKAAQRLLADLEKTGTCKVSFSAEENLPVLENEKHIILFRMIQEIINNIIKHAKAGHIKFTAGKKPGQIIVAIEDDGKGFEIEKIVKGAGLQNLENRSAMIGAKMNIQSAPGIGTCVTIAINS